MREFVSIEAEWREFCHNMSSHDLTTLEQVCYYSGFQAGFHAAMQYLGARCDGLQDEVSDLAQSIGVPKDELEAAKARMHARTRRPSEVKH